MIDGINNVLNSLVDSLRLKGISDHDILDLLFTLLFWKYISDTSKGKEHSLSKEFLFENAIRLDDSPIEQKIEEALDKWSKINDKEFGSFNWINERIIKHVGNKELTNLCFKLEAFFSSGWIWLQENTIELFNAIESLFANSISFAHLLLTPPEIVKLTSSFLIPGKDIRIYDPFCRSGELLSESICHVKEIKQVTGNADSILSLKISIIKSLMLQFPESEIKYRTIYNEINEKFDRIITNPPFGGRPTRSFHEAGEWSKNFGGLRNELDFLCHVLDHLNDKGQAAIIIPIGILFSTGRIQQFRQQLIKSDMVEAIVSLPSKIFYQTGVITAILLINRNKTTDNVLLINATEMGDRQRDRHKFSNDDVTNLINLVKSYREGKELDEKFKGICVKVKLPEFERNNFDLQFSTYKKEEKDYSLQLRSSKEIWNEIVALKKELDICHKNISALMKEDNESL